MNYGFVIDNGSCIGCHACSTACKSENQVPLGVYRTWVKTVEVGLFPDVRRAFQVTRCNHCSNAPCVRICPTGAMHRRPDGIVDFDSNVCIGCKGCIQACPYDSIHIDPETHTAAKCNFCAHRVEVGLEPACVVVCPEHAIIAGDLDDPSSEIARVLAREAVSVRKPEQGTAPKLFYVDANHASIDPTAAPPADGYAAARSQSRSRAPHAGPGAPKPIRQAAQRIRVSYDVEHEVYWHWPIPAYLVTKHVAGGAFLYLAVRALGGSFDPTAMAFGGGLGLAALLVTFALLIYDLDRPDRFLFLFTRPQWRSWIARAAWLLAGFSALAGGWWAVELGLGAGVLPQGLASLRPAFAAVVAPVAVLAAVYSAFLFAQAEGRDLWQAPHLVVLLGAQAVLLGAVPFAAAGDPVAAGWVVAGALSALLLALVDLRTLHGTEVARLAALELTRGRFRWWWRGGIAVGYLAPLAAIAAGVPLLAAIAAPIGVHLASYALVMAPQAIRNS